MDSSYDVPDPSDWLDTSLVQLVPVEAALRCQVCKDFFDTPMITSCSHTFCSLCIRRCLTNDGKCPACRAPDQELRLRRNWTVQEIVDAFKIARPAVLQLGQTTKNLIGKSRQTEGKRKLDDTDIEKNGPEEEKRVRRTRSQKKRISNSEQLESSYLTDDERDENYESEDGLTACPICNQRMKVEEVFTHLDIHIESSDASAGVSKTEGRSPPVKLTSRPRQNPKPVERLPQLNYSLMNDNSLRKKLMGLGIPNGGPRTLLEKRHMEWINLVNANCDSNKPRKKRELLKDLDVWDRSQGRQISNGISGTNDGAAVMRKDFDGVAWATNHNDDFQRLISQARPRNISRDESNTKTVITTNDPPNSNHSHPDRSQSFNARGVDISNNPRHRSVKPSLNESVVPDSHVHNSNPHSGVGIRRSWDTIVDLED